MNFLKTCTFFKSVNKFLEAGMFSEIPYKFLNWWTYFESMNKFLKCEPFLNPMVKMVQDLDSLFRRQTVSKNESAKERKTPRLQQGAHV